MKLPRIFGRERKPSIDEYELCGSEIVRGRGLHPEDRLRVADIRSWQIHPEMVFDMVQITLTDGLEFVWLDKHDDLIGILRRVAPTAEMDVV
jgi:hypothetical protein